MGRRSGGLLSGGNDGGSTRPLNGFDRPLLPKYSPYVRSLGPAADSIDDHSALFWSNCASRHNHVLERKLKMSLRIAGKCFRMLSLDGVNCQGLKTATWPKSFSTPCSDVHRRVRNDVNRTSLPLQHVNKEPCPWSIIPPPSPSLKKTRPPSPPIH